MPTIAEIQQERLDALGEARAIQDAADAENRDLTDDEQTRFDAHWTDYERHTRRWNLANAEADSDRWREDISNDRAQQTAEQRLAGTETVLRLIRGDFSVDDGIDFNVADAHQIRVLQMRGATLGEARAELAARKAEIRERHPELRALSVGSDDSVVPTGFLTRLIDYRQQYSGFMRAMPFVFPTSGGAPIEVPKVLTQGTATFVAEAATVAGTDPTFGTVTLNAYKYGQLVAISRELSEDNAVMLEEWLARDMGRAIGRVMDSEFMIGTTANRPFGILSGSAGISTAVTGSTGVGGAPSVDNLIDLKYAVDEAYDNERAFFIMRRASVGGIRKLKDTQGRYLWQPSTQMGEPDTLLGNGVVTTPHAPAFAVDALSVAFGNINDGCMVREAGPLRIERSEHSHFSTDQIAYRAIQRADMEVVDANAIRIFAGGTA